jgi:hypothetical protein
MSNAKDTAPAAAAGAIVPEKLLDEGEVVILAIKPSVWYVLLNSFPAVAAASAIALAGYAAGSVFDIDLAPKVVLLLCAAMALAKVLVSCVQWAGRLYVLTNVRIMRVRGVLRLDVFQCPLKGIKELNLSASVPERMLSVGSLWFHVEGSQAEETAWLHIAQPHEVHEIVSDAIKRARP